jgi:IS6 family transposase
MLAPRGVNVDHSTIYRWVQRYAPEMEKRRAGTGVTLPIFARGAWMKPT